jgi:hypothetical protein
VLRLPPWPSRPKPADPRAQRVLEWTDVVYYVLSRVVGLAALVQIVIYAPTALQAL